MYGLMTTKAMPRKAAEYSSLKSRMIRSDFHSAPDIFSLLFRVAP